MNLGKYQKKRDFERTPEPRSSAGQEASGELRFVIQKHQASHLHYDLRLEAGGALKSWAVPKGPSLDPARKKLAILVEDHPIEYRDFEGIIPEGNYGAGTVMIWDEGTYHMHNTSGEQATNQAMLDSLQKGNAAFFLEGQKLRGWFHLTKIRNAKQVNSWLLFKKSDEFSSDKDVLENDRSVRSGKTLDEIRDGEIVHPAKHHIDITKIDLHGAIRAPFPSGPIKPMLAQLVDEPFDNKDWLFEIKWDGYRAIAEIRNGSVKLYSRKGLGFYQGFAPVQHDLEQIGFDAVLDGEIVVLDKNGRADFGALQNYRSSNAGVLIYYVFDALFISGFDIRDLPLEHRKNILHETLPSLPHIRYNDHIEEHGIGFYNAARKGEIEGIVAKEKRSSYLPGIRTQHWQKIKIRKAQEVVIGGFSEPRGGRIGFGALLAGVYENNNLIYVGHVGGGFTDEELPIIRARLERYRRTGSPFANIPPIGTGVTWIEPVLVGEVTFAEWTSEGIMRQPVFMGFRDDVEPQNVRREIPVASEQTSLRFARSDTSEQQISIDGRVLNLTNLAKVYWPRDSLTKGDMIDYYREIAPVMLPHLIDRPQSLHRFPDGIDGKDFFHKDILDAPPWASVVPVPSESQGAPVRYLLCQDEAALVYMANLGSIEINPWLSRTGNLDNPDFCVIDLDPIDCSFDDVIRTVLAAYEILGNADIPGYVKTSGATGMHIFMPLGARYSYDQSRQFSNLICTLVNRKLPSITSLERIPGRRKGRVYLDFLQNIKGKTMAAPYSLRPHDKAPCSAPLAWEEVRPGLRPDQFTLKTMLRRVEHRGDLWKGVLGSGIDMAQSLQKLQQVIDTKGSSVTEAP